MGCVKNYEKQFTVATSVLPEEAKQNLIATITTALEVRPKLPEDIVGTVLSFVGLFCADARTPKMELPQVVPPQQNSSWCIAKPLLASLLAVPVPIYVIRKYLQARCLK